MVANAREFLLAIKESTHTVFDEDAVEFLENLREFASQSLDKQTNLHRHERDGVMFFEGLLRGVQLKLTHRKQQAASKLSEMGLLENGVPKLGEN
jgi:hypothetical protein